MPSSPDPRRAPAAVASALAAVRRPSLARIVALALAAAPAWAPACGGDTDPRCDQSFLRYDNFGAPFLANWCRACHSAELPADMRQQAPASVNFDDLADVRAWSGRIRFTAGAPDAATMPPAGGPSPGERAMLVEWLGCGAP
jgi:uncharacterized membrane protein